MQVVGNGRVVLHDFGVGGGELVHRTRWGWFLWFVRRRGDDRRDLHRDFERRRPGALVPALEFVAANGVAGAAVVDGVRTFAVTVIGCYVEVETAGGVVVIAAAAGVSVGVAGASVADDVGCVDVAADGDVGVTGVEGAAGVEGVEGACGGDNAGGVFDIASVCGVEDVAAAPVIVIVGVETWGR